MINLSHCGNIIYTHDRDRFLLSLFAPMPAREALQAVYALNSELARIGSITSEELIGQVRLAWWQERIEDLYGGKSTAGHPVLEALQPVTRHVPKDMLIGLVEKYRESFAWTAPPPAGGRLGGGHFITPEHASPYPGPPPTGEGIIETISLELLRSLCPGAELQWRKACGIIASHRKRYGQRRSGWMSFRLLTGF